MIVVSGQVAKLIRDSDSKLKGLLLKDGLEIRLPAKFGGAVSAIIREGCFVRIEGVACSDDFMEGYLDANLVTNLDSKQSATLPALKHEGKPGMPLDYTPVEPAPLAPRDSQFAENQPCGSLTDPDESTPPSKLSECEGVPLRSASFFREMLNENGTAGENLARNDAARSIGCAYDSLHRIQAILAYLHIMKHRVPGISQFLDEAKHTYVQAMARFATGDFISAKEFAEASGSLSRVVEIVMTRTLRADSTLPSLVPPPPKHSDASPEPEHVEEHLAQAESVLSRIHWVLEHGTLPSEDRAQVRKIASWGDAFYQQAQRTYRNAVLEDASEFAQAALAGAYSAEHVCRKWYVTHPLDNP